MNGEARSPHVIRTPCRTKKRTLSVALAVLLLLGLGCRGGEAPHAGGAKKLDQVRLNFNPIASYAPFVMAKERGYFTAERIDPVFIAIDQNSTMLALLDGKLDVASAPLGTGMFNMVARGQRIQIVAEKGHAAAAGCTTEAFTAPAAMAERIARRGSIRGERIATRSGGLMEYLVDTFIEKEHLQPADVEFVQLPAMTDFTDRRRGIDAIRYTAEPTLSSVLADGRVKIVASTGEIAPGHTTNVVLFGARLLDRDRELGRRFMRAYLRGVHDFNQGKTEANIASVSRLTKLEPDVVRRACWPVFAEDGKVTPQSVQPFLDWARRRQYLDSDVPVSAWWNPSFVEAAARSAGTASPANPTAGRSQ